MYNAARTILVASSRREGGRSDEEKEETTRSARCLKTRIWPVAGLKKTVPGRHTPIRDNRKCSVYLIYWTIRTQAIHSPGVFTPEPCPVRLTPQRPRSSELPAPNLRLLRRDPCTHILWASCPNRLYSTKRVFVKQNQYRARSQIPALSRER